MNKKEFAKALKPRRKSKEVLVGQIGIGGENPVRVQTMTNTDIADIKKTVAQIIDCYNNGAELVRLAARTPFDVKLFLPIRQELKKRKIKIPLIADVHFLPETAFCALDYADKIRINPGNFISPNAFKNFKLDNKSYGREIALIENSLAPFIKAAKKKNIPLRLGANHGSLSERIMKRYGNTALGMALSAMEYLRIFKKYKYNSLVVALKSSDPLIMIESNRLLVELMDKENMSYPVHLGVTEAGNAEDGRIKSSIGIGTLLLEGIGDTIRVSLSENPANEMATAYSILQAAGRRITKTEIISCPTCSRTLYNLEKVANEIKKKLSGYPGLKIAVMGCIVNGLGEMAEADYAVIGGKPKKLNLYFKKKLIARDIDENKIAAKLTGLVKKNRI